MLPITVSAALSYYTLRRRLAVAAVVSSHCKAASETRLPSHGERSAAVICSL